MDEPQTLAWIGATFLLAGWVKGVVGMGLPTVAMGALVSPIWLSALAFATAFLIAGLNVKLVYDFFLG